MFFDRFFFFAPVKVKSKQHLLNERHDFFFHVLFLVEVPSDGGVLIVESLS